LANAAILPMVNMSFEALLRSVRTHAKDGTDKLPINSKSIQGCFDDSLIFWAICVGDACIDQICSLESQDETLLKVSSVRCVSVRRTLQFRSWNARVDAVLLQPK
jgi:hypothetical protein